MNLDDEIVWPVLDCVLELLPLVLKNFHRISSMVVSARIRFYRRSVS